MNIFIDKKYIKEVSVLLPQDEISILEAKKRPQFITRTKENFLELKRLLTIRRRGMGGMMGGGGVPDFTEVYKHVGTSAMVLVANGLAWDLIKLSLKKTYSIFKSRKKYIEIVDPYCEPGSCHIVKFLIPLNLDSDKLDNVLSEAENIANSFVKIRFYFNSKQIIFKYKKHWRIKIKK